MSNTKLRRRAMLGGGGPIEVVDFGLSVKWLKYNLAGDKLTDDESDYGYYYQWGSTTGYPDATKHIFDWSTTPYCNGFSTSLTKYVINSEHATVDNKTTLESSDDAVTVLLGSEYRTPTTDEFKELYNHCGGTDSGSLFGATSVSKNGIYWITSGTTVDGVKYKNAGRLFVGQDISKRIFFPASGYCYNSSVKDVGSEGYYWSSSLNSSYSYGAYALYFRGSNINPAIINLRSTGYSVRGVKVK